MADITDYLGGLNYTFTPEEKQLMDVFAESWEHCNNTKCTKCKYAGNNDRVKMLICVSYQYAQRLIKHGIKVCTKESAV